MNSAPADKLRRAVHHAPPRARPRAAEASPSHPASTAARPASVPPARVRAPPGTRRYAPAADDKHDGVVGGGVSPWRGAGAGAPRGALGSNTANDSVSCEGWFAIRDSTARASGPLAAEQAATPFATALTLWP